MWCLVDWWLVVDIWKILLWYLLFGGPGSISSVEAMFGLRRESLGYSCGVASQLEQWCCRVCGKWSSKGEGKWKSGSENKWGKWVDRGFWVCLPPQEGCNARLVCPCGDVFFIMSMETSHSLLLKEQRNLSATLDCARCGGDIQSCIE